MGFRIKKAPVAKPETSEEPKIEIIRESGIPEEPKEVKEESEKVKEVKQRIVVVKELPLQPVREAVLEDGTKIYYITMEEALTEVMNQ